MRNTHLIIVCSILLFTSCKKEDKPKPTETELPALEWAFSIGGTSLESPVSLKTDAAGNMYVLGVFENTVDFDPGPGTVNLTGDREQYFLAKYNSKGELIFANNMGPRSITYRKMVCDLAGNVYLNGSFTGTVDFDPGPGEQWLTGSTTWGESTFLAKYDPSGNYIFVKQPVPGIYDFALDQSGNIYLTGRNNGLIDFDLSAGVHNVQINGAFAAKYTPSFDLVYAKNLKGIYGGHIEVDDDENAYIIGVMLPDEYYNTLPNPGTDQEDYRVSYLKLNASGAYENASAGLIDQQDIFRLHDMDIDVHHNLYICGELGYFFLGKYNAKGEPQSNFLLTPLDVIGKSMALSNDGSLYFSGQFFSNGTTVTVDMDPGPKEYLIRSENGQDEVLAKYNSDGKLLFARLIDINVDIIHVDNANNVYIAGYYGDDYGEAASLTRELGEGAPVFKNNGVSDIYIAKYRKLE